MTAYTLFSQATNWSLDSDTNSYTLGVQFAVSESVSLTGIWFHSASGAGSLPVQCVIFDADTQAEVSGTLNTSPSWSGAAASGWVKCSYGGSVTLAPGVHYIAAVLDNQGTRWYSALSAYWTSGAGSGGITNGPLSAPASSAALNGQAIYHAGSSLTFPATTVGGYDFGVDVEVTPAGVTGTGAVAMAAMAVAGTEAEVFSARGAVAMAAMAVAGEGAVVGSNVTATGAVGMAAMAVHGSGAHAAGFSAALFDDERSIRAKLRWLR